MRLDTLLVKVASKCNINCSYCYVYNMGDDGWKDMPALMAKDTIAALTSAVGQLVADQAKPFATVLHGGEPLMLGPRRLDHLLRLLRSKLPASHSLCMQTNGMLLTSDIASICAEHRVTVSVSVDGTKKINDRFRIGKRGESMHEKVLAGIDVLRRHPDSEFLYSGLLAVINPTTQPGEVYTYLTSLGAPSIDFLYRDGNHSNVPFGKESFESTEYGDWLSILLDIYLADRTPPRVRFLDDIIRLSLGGRGVKEGLGESDYGIAIVETDGTISKNDTLKSSFDGADRFVQTWSVHTHRFADIFATDEFAQYHELQRPTSLRCSSCSYLRVCGGGMPLHRWSMDQHFDNPSIYCNDQKVIISKVFMRLKKEGLSLDPQLSGLKTSAEAVSV